MKQTQSTTNSNSVSSQRVRMIVLTAMLGAISSVLMLFEFPLPFVPDFIKFDFSELPVIIGAFLLGPAWGVAVAALKVLLHFVLKGTSTMGVGELANFIGSCAYILPASLYYIHMKSKKSAEIGLAIGTLTTSIAMVICNTVLTFPLYIKMFGMTEEIIIKMGSAVNPLIKDMTTMMLFSIFPFNIVKYGIVSVITLLVYKKISKAYHGMH